jgi:lipoate-protein ligase A
MQELLKSLMLDLSIKTRFEFIESSQLSAVDNMREDRYILSSFFKDNIPKFRIYTWGNSCTIGVSQIFEKLPQIIEYKNNYAKRLTGGGILFHGDDISYSFVIPTHYMDNKSVKDSYKYLCKFLLDFYKILGLNAMFAIEDKNINFSKNEYCQVGFEEYDIVIDGKKIGGNAQKRTKKAIFQHGSIRLKTTIHNKEYGNSLEDFGIKIDFKEAKKLLIDSFKCVFNIKFN